MKRLALILVLAGCTPTATPVEPVPKPPEPVDLGRCHLSCCNQQVLELQARTAQETGDSSIEHECCFCEDSPEPTKSFTALRLIPLSHGEPIGCQLDLDRPPVPCDIELTPDGTVYDRRFTSQPIGRLQVGLTLLSVTSNQPVFAVRSDGILVGTGPVHEGTEHAQVLFCKLGLGADLDCVHEFDQALIDRDLIWNEDNCGKPGERWTATVNGDEVVVHFAGYPAETATVAARLEPPPADHGGRLIALYLYGLIAVQGETTIHAPKPPE
jgi:hypothetical protein